MQRTDTKFFTNEPNNTLYERFAAILKSNTQFFDVLVGYFRSSGFFSMYDALKDVEKIRILVGLNVDKHTIEFYDMANEQYTIFDVSTNQGKMIMQKEVEQEFAETEPSSDVEKGVRIFIEWLKSGKMEMRMYIKNPIHAKVYIMRKDPQKVPDMFGSVITGSSNFSVAGLKNNLEFNVELKDTPDVKFALDRFEALWADGVDITSAYIEAVEQNTWMRDDITPYEIFLKTLYEYFKEEINDDKNKIDELLPKGYMPLQYQFDAVTQAKKKLDAYNGVFISDVVGLGKTYICALLAKTFNRSSWKLIICPPVLKDYWESVLKEFDVARCDVESLGKLDKVVAKGTEKYEYVFIDEAHRFRNSDNESYSMLHQICRGKKVVLISATPINNYTSDIENQLYLFQAKQSGNINGVKNLDGFFRGLESQLNKFDKGSPEYKKQLHYNSEVIRDRLLREVMIRRTRSEVQKYYAKDLESQGLTFPKAGNPEKIIYTFDEQMDATFSETIKTIKTFKYARYTPLLYLREKDEYSTILVSQRNMGGFMKGVLVKRLESSFYAFRRTLGRFIESYENFIKMYEGGEVYISKKINVYDLLENEDEAALLYHIEHQNIMKFSSGEFEPSFIRDLRNDLIQLQYLRDMWADIKTDPKLDEFRSQLLNNETIKGKKIIVFTESKETAEYLADSLKDLYGSRLVYFSGQSSGSLKASIEDSFNPKYKDKGNDKYDLLITTDVLAEGINLHRANILINYDLPWNPTRIMQRVGRINRVGSEFDRIYVYNFFPTAQSASQMPLEDRILDKLQAFHDTLGNDFRILSEEEDVSPKGLFERLNSNPDDDETSTNPELAYLQKIREIRDTDSDLYSKIRAIPPKAKTGKNSPVKNERSTLSFIRKGAYKTFFKNASAEPEQLSFMEAIQQIECEPDELKLNVGSEYYDQLKINTSAFDEFLREEKEITLEKPMLTGNDKKAINLFKAIVSSRKLTEDEEEAAKKLIARWENGEINDKVSKDVIKESKLPHSDAVELYHALMKHVPETYLEDVKENRKKDNAVKEVVLSCYLKGAV